ncbi:MAG: replication-relaxation family protein [Verrucomicrobiota bacterium]
MGFPHLPRFKRSAAAGLISLTDRDHAIIRLIHRHRFLRSSQIIALIGGSPQQPLRRLQLLYHHGYLERPRAQLDYFHHGGSRHMVYGLGSKGAGILKQESGGSVRKPPWGEKNRAVGRIFLDHTLMVSDVMVALELACRQSGQIRLLTEVDLSLRSSRWKVTLQGGAKLGVIPDRIFALEFPRENGKRERILFFLEADRGTMPVIRRNLSQTSMYRKFLAYAATWSQAIHLKRFGFHRFRVLTVTTNAARVQSLIEACGQLKRGHGLFLFADQSVLAQPDLLHALIWQTGKSGAMESLLN